MTNLKTVASTVAVFCFAAASFASEEVKTKILKNMSSRAKALIIEEMEVMGPTRMKNTEEAQQKIVNTIRQLEEMGEIVVARGGEEEVFV